MLVITYPVVVCFIQESLDIWFSGLQKWVGGGMIKEQNINVCNKSFKINHIKVKIFKKTIFKWNLIVMPISCTNVTTI